MTSVAIYCRCSTLNQDIDKQVSTLKEVAERAGWTVDKVFLDEGISGAKTKDQRPALKELLNTLTRREVSKVLVYSVDRLGRSLKDLLSILEEIKDTDASLYIHNQALDTDTIAGKALFSLLGVFAEMERATIRERVIWGLEKAKKNGKKLGRRSLRPYQIKDILKLSEEGMKQTEIAKKLNISQASVSKTIRANLAA